MKRNRLTLPVSLSECESYQLLVDSCVIDPDPLDFRTELTNNSFQPSKGIL